MSTYTESLPVPVKKVPRSNHQFVTYLNKVADSIDGNASFPNASPPAATIRAAANGLADANAKAKNGGAAAVADRNAKRNDAEEIVDQVVGYVRTTVKAHATDPANAAAMILSAGLSVRKRTKAQKPPLAAKYGPFAGDVLLVALALAGAGMYLWEYSLDQRVWTSVPQTMKASTTIAGLTPGQVYSFRFRVQTRKGMSEYSPVVSLVMR